MKLFLAFLLITLSPAAQAREMEDGHDRGNAGDTFTAEFTLTARDIVARLKLLPQSELAGIDMNRLQGAVLSAAIHSEEKLSLRGYEVDAINIPEKMEILISRTRWRALRPAQETTARLTLVLHEFLFLAGTDDTNYKYSGRLIPQLGVENFNPNRWWNPLNPANRVTTNLEYRPEGCEIAALDFKTAEQMEEVSVATTGDCGDAFRQVSVKKSSFAAPPSSGARGAFHRFEISVLDSRGGLLGGLTYEPEWGQCLLPQDGSCQLSGKLFVGGVELQFWLMR